jgi:hypothetical protein
MLSTLLNLIRSTAFLYVGGTLAGVGVAALLGRIWKTMGLRFFLLGLGGVLLCILFVVVIVLLWRVLERWRGDNLENALGQDAAARQQQRQQGKMAVQGLKDRWAEAMATLESTKVRIYDLPWLLLIGEPQSGKTTTLRESGLDFPLGKDSLSGAGGTVNCDWWFTNESVIIDTAGRFTMPVDTASDREEWHAFLKLLARHRPRCPINGVVVTIPATSLLQDPPETVKNKALTIREKLQELVAVLGIEFPVYIMVSKLDLVYGFAEFCASLSNEDRQQALGWNRQNMTPEAFRQDEFEAFSSTLVERLNEWARRRLRDVNPGVEADRIYAFPSEFDRLRDALTGYLSLIFRPDRYHIPLLLRGCYFSSGLQEGKSIARAVLEGAEGGDRGVLAEFAKSFVQSRAYFIHAFYSKVFKERWLVKRAGGATKKEVTIKLAAAGFGIFFLVIAGSMLFSGYRSLVEKVSPLEQQVRNAERVLKNGDIGQIRASEIVQMLQTLDAGRQELINHGAKRFLRTSENTLVEDIGLIEDTLFERRFLDILVTGVEKDLSDEKSIQSIDEKDQLYKMLLQYIEILAGKPLNTQSMAFLLDLVPWKSTEQVDIDRQAAEQIIQSYPYWRDKGKGSGNIETGGLYIRQMLTSIHRFWDSFYGIQWQEQKKQLALINTTYAELLDGNVLSASGIKTSGNEQFIQLANNFKEAIAEIDPTAEGKILVWTNNLREKCQADYQNVQKKLAKIPSASISLMAATAERHSSVCSQLESGVGSEWGAAIEQNHHIVLADGSVNPEMSIVRDSILKIAALGPLFTAEMKEQLKGESENPLPVLGSWHQAWRATQSEMMKEITTELAMVNSNRWQKNELFFLCNEQLNKAILQADQEAALEAIQVVMAADPDAEISARGNEIPKAMRASWLASRFMVIQKVGDWMQTIHPGSPDLVQVRSAIGNAMASSWSNCLKFWSERLNGVDPAAGILKTDSWKSFRKEVLARHGAFIDLAAWPLNAFFEFMASKDVQDVRDIMHNFEGSPGTSNEVFVLEQRVINTSSVYAATRFLPQLNEAQRTFNSAVENLTDDPWESIQILKNGKPGEKVFMDNLKSLGEFQKRISRDPAGQNEPMALRLTKIEDHAVSLLKNDLSSAVGKDWQRFVTTWHSRLAGKFPFGNQALWDGGDSTSNNIRKLSLITASKGDLYDFFFSQEGLEAFAKKYNIMDTDSSIRKHKASSLDGARQEFLEKCLAWRNFLFDRDGHPRGHQVRIALEDEHGQHGISAQTTFTKLTMTGMENDKDKSVRLRFSGQKYKAATINWEIGLNHEISMEAKNEETGFTSTIKINGGNLGFPAYVFWEGKQKGRNSSGELGLNMLFPKFVAPLLIKVEEGSVGLSYYRVPVTISWDQALPENIPWPTK